STISASPTARSLGIHGVEPPRAGHTLELVLAALVELDARPGYKVLHGLRDEHLTGARRGRDTGADHDREARDLALVHLALTGMHARPDLEAKPTDLVDDRARAADGPSGPVEGREEPVAGRVLLLAAIARELAPHERVMAFEELPPSTVAELGRHRARAHDVGEQHGREHRVGNLGDRLHRAQPVGPHLELPP